MLEYYTVENTGWSGGISWFTTGGSRANPLRFKTKSDAEVYATHMKEALNDPDTKWRIVHTIIKREETKEITTRQWNEV